MTIVHGNLYRFVFTLQLPVLSTYNNLFQPGGLQMSYDYNSPYSQAMWPLAGISDVMVNNELGKGD